jgi:hypothetical protein
LEELSMSFNVDAVRNAWENQQRAARKAMRDARLAAGEAWQSVDDDSVDMYSYVKEVWNDYIIVDAENLRKTNQYWKIPYTVDEKTSNVTFGARQLVKQEYVPLSAQDAIWENPQGPAVNKLKLLVGE